MAEVTLTGRGRKRLLGGHPWIYADDVHASEAEPGALVALRAPDEEARAEEMARFVADLREAARHAR